MTATIIDLTAIRLQRKPSSYVTAVLRQDPGNERYGVENAEGELDHLTRGKALFDGWLAITTDEALVPVGDVTVAYIVVRKDGTTEAWVDEDAGDVLETLKESLDNGLRLIEKCLVPEKFG